MANLKEIRIRIASVKSTRKITSAMSRIAAARLRRAQNAMAAAREYGTRMASIVGEVLAELDDPGAAHPLLAGAGTRTGTIVGEVMDDLGQDGSDAILMVIVTAERGLCGGFNSGVNRAAEREIKALRAAGRKVEIVTVGRKGRDYLGTYGAQSTEHHAAPTKPNEVVEIARDVAAELMALFQAEPSDDRPTISEVRVVYNLFQNVITQEVRSERILPVPFPEGTNEDEADTESRAATAVRSFEPDSGALLDHLLPVAVETAVQQVLYNSVVSEVAARRMAMDSATDNASELIKELTLLYNRERQAAITKELMEIIGGAEALRG